MLCLYPYKKLFVLYQLLFLFALLYLFPTPWTKLEHRPRILTPCSMMHIKYLCVLYLPHTLLPPLILKISVTSKGKAKCFADDLLYYCFTFLFFLFKIILTSASFDFFIKLLNSLFSHGELYSISLS